MLAPITRRGIRITNWPRREVQENARLCHEFRILPPTSTSVQIGWESNRLITHLDRNGAASE